jgi:Recombinase
VAQLFDWYLEPRATVYRLARRLTDLGVATPRGGPRWNTASVRGILRNTRRKGPLAGPVPIPGRDRAPGRVAANAAY